MSCQPEDCSKTEQPTKPNSNEDFPFLLRGLIHGAFAVTMLDSTVTVCGSLHKAWSSHEQSCCGDFPTDPQEIASREAVHIAQALHHVNEREKASKVRSSTWTHSFRLWQVPACSTGFWCGKRVHTHFACVKSASRPNPTHSQMVLKSGWNAEVLSTGPC